MEFNYKSNRVNTFEELAGAAFDGNSSLNLASTSFTFITKPENVIADDQPKGGCVSEQHNCVSTQKEVDVNKLNTTNVDDPNKEGISCNKTHVYCCDRQCFIVPEDQVDGMACTICRSYGYCKCYCYNNRLASFEMDSLTNRLNSFKFNYRKKSKISETLKVIGYYRLAKSGFYFTPSAKSKDRVTCIWCGLVLHDWEEHDDPEMEHQLHAPHCDKKHHLAETSYIDEYDANTYHPHYCTCIAGKEKTETVIKARRERKTTNGQTLAQLRVEQEKTLKAWQKKDRERPAGSADIFYTQSGVINLKPNWNKEIVVDFHNDIFDYFNDEHFTYKINDLNSYEKLLKYLSENFYSRLPGKEIVTVLFYLNEENSTINFISDNEQYLTFLDTCKFLNISTHIREKVPETVYNQVWDNAFDYPVFYTQTKKSKVRHIPMLTNASYEAYKPKNVRWLFNAVELATYSIYFYQNEFTKCKDLVTKKKQELKHAKNSIRRNYKNLSYEKRDVFKAQMFSSITGGIARASGINDMTTSIRETSDTANLTLNELNNTLKDFKEQGIFSKMANMTETVTKLCNTTNNVVEGAGSLMTSLKEYFTGDNKWMSKAIVIGSLTAFFVQVGFSVKNCFIYFAGICGTLGIGPDFFQNSYYKVKKYLGDRFKAQSKNSAEEPELDDKLSLLGAIAETFANALNFNIPMTSILKKLSDFGRAFSGGEKIFSVLNKLFEWVRDKYYRHTTGMSYEQVSMQVQYPELAKLAECCFFVMQSTPDMIKDSRELCERIIEIDTLAAEMLLSTLKQNQIGPYIKLLRNNMIQLVEAAKNSPAMANSQRPVPFALYMYGRPGTGKTNLTDIIKAKMFAKYFSKDFGRSFEHATYSRKTENEYWDGYAQHPIVGYDDIFQVVDSPTAANPEVMEIIRVVNDDSFQLHMSAVKDKSNTFFKSKLVVATSNVRNPKAMIKSINDPSAVTRRFTMALHVEVNKEYGKDAYAGQELYQQVDARKVKTLLDTDCYKLTLYDLQKEGNPIIREYKPVDDKNSFDVMLEDLMEMYDFHISQGSTRAALLSEMAGQCTIGDPTSGNELAAKIGTVAAGINTFPATVKSLSRAPLVPSYTGGLAPPLTPFFSQSGECATIQDSVEESNEFKQSEIFERASSWEDSVMDSETMIEGTRSWRGRLNDIHSTTSTMIQDLCERMRLKMSNVKNALIERYGDPFGKPISVKLNEGWEAIKSKFMTFKENFAARANHIDWSFAYYKDLFFENMGTVFLGIIGTVSLVFGSSKLFRHHTKQVCPIVLARTTEDVLEESSCVCEACSYLRPFVNELDNLDSKSKVSMTLIEDLLKNGNITNAQKDKLTELSKSKEFFNLMRTKESPKIRKLRAELASGDYITKRGPQVHVTEVASGDYITKKGVPMHVSEVASGDYQTKKGLAIHVTEDLAQRVKLAEARLPNNVPLVGGIQAQALYDGPSSESGNSMAHKDQMFIQQHNKVVSRSLVSVVGSRQVDAMYTNETSVNGIMLTGRIMMVNHHFLRELDPKEGDFRIHLPLRQNGGTVIRMKDCKFHRMKTIDNEELDLVLVSLPNILPSFPDITNMFAKPNEIDNIQEGHCYLSGLEIYKITGKSKEMRMMVRDMLLPDISIIKREVEYIFNSTSKTYKLSGSLQYTAPTQPGHCGFLVFAHSVPMKGRICGVHVAGSKQTGMAITLTDALIKRNMDEMRGIEPDKRKFVQGSFSTQLKSETIYVDPFLSISELNVEGDYMNIGIAEKTPRPVKTALSKSPIHGEIYPTRTKPAHLKPVRMEDGSVVCPLKKGIKKSFTIQPNVDMDILKAASNDVFQMFEKDSTDITRLLTYEEAITGIDGVEFAASMNRTTSAGFPFVLSKDNFGKRKWLGHTEEWDTTNKELRARVDNIIENAKQNKRTEVVFMSTLKDERRPFSKVDQVKTRVFEAGPMDYSIAVRKYFMGFVESVMRKRIRNEVCVGINAYSMDWHRLAMHLRQKGSHVIAGDFSNFDGSLLQIILWEIVEIINRWYDDCEENQLVRQVLYEEIVNTFVLVDGVIIQKTHSQPSGNPLTVIVNSLFNQIVMRMAYLILKREQKLGILCDFTDHVAMATYGDDNVLNISPRVIKWYNQVEITRALATFGLTYTDEAKSGLCVPYRELSEVNFLKRRFVKNEDGTFIAPLDIDVIRDMTNWIRGTKPKDSLLENVNSALLEFGLHGKENYEHEVQLLRDACAKVRVKPRFPTYAEMSSIYATHRAQ